MDNNITIKAEAALEDAKAIDTIVESIAKDMEVLNQKFKTLIPERINTTWSNQVKENWEGYYSEEIPAAMENMKKSAANLRGAVEAFVGYSNESQL